MENFERTLRKLRQCLYIYVGETKRCGFGIFAARPFKKGVIIMVDDDGDYYDNVYSYHDLRTKGCDLQYTLQVGIDAFKLPNGSIDDLTNHSCDPNTGIRLTEKGTIIVALRDIAAHAELTYDYSTYLNNPYERLRCRCGKTNCRGIIGNFRTLPKDLQRKYLTLGVVGDFVLDPLPQRTAATRAAVL